MTEEEEMKQNKSRLDFSHVWGVHWQVWRTAVGRVSPAFHEVILGEQSVPVVKCHFPPDYN